MEKIIFFGLVFPIFAFVLYLGVNAIMKGTEAKNALKKEEKLNNNENENLPENKKNLSEELDKLNNLLKDFLFYCHHLLLKRVIYYFPSIIFFKTFVYSEPVAA